MEFSHLDTVEDIALAVIALIGAMVTYFLRRKKE